MFSFCEESGSLCSCVGVSFFDDLLCHIVIGHVGVMMCALFIEAVFSKWVDRWFGKMSVSYMCNVRFCV